jgi:hypothetical protein
MPAKTAKQYRLMAAIAHGAKPKGGKGPSREVAEEFVKETPPAKRREFMAQLKGRGKRK